MPLITLAGWLLGIDLAYFQMVERRGYREVLDLISFFGEVIAMFGATFAAWVVYNYLLFKVKNHRVSCKSVSEADLCDFFKVEEELLNASRNSSLIEVLLNDEGEIEGIWPKLDEVHGSEPELADLDQCA